MSQERLSATTTFNVLLLTAVSLLVVAFLFSNVFPAILSFGIMLFLIYHRIGFLWSTKNSPVTVEREVIDKMVFQAREFTVKVKVFTEAEGLRVTVKEELSPGVIFKGGKLEHSFVSNGPTYEEFEYRVVVKRRGNSDLAKAMVSTMDRRGLFKRTYVDPSRYDVRAHSSLDAVKRAKALAKGQSLEITDKTRSRMYRVRQSDYDGVRDYDPTDRIRDVDWKASSRLLKMMTKVFENEASVPTYLMMDSSRKMRKGTKGNTKLDHGVALAIQLLKVFHSKGHPVGMAVYDEKRVVDFIEPGTKKEQYNILFERLHHLPGSIVTGKESKVSATAMDVSVARIMAEEEKPDQQTVTFMGKVAPFVSKVTPDRIGGDMRSTRGVYQAVERMARKAPSGELFIFITDMETDADALLKAVKLANARKGRVVVISPFTGYYNYSEADIEPSLVEKLYMRYKKRSVIISRLRSIGVTVIDTNEKMDGSAILRNIKGLA